MNSVQSADGTRLAYDVYGSDPPLLSIIRANCVRSFQPIVRDANAFAREFTVYTPGILIPAEENSVCHH